MVLFVHMPGLEDKSKKSKAERIAFDLLEYLDQINYNKYYDAMGSPGTRGGEKEKLFSDFSYQSIKAAQACPQDLVFKHQQLAVRLYQFFSSLVASSQGCHWELALPTDSSQYKDIPQLVHIARYSVQCPCFLRNSLCFCWS